MGVGVYVTSQEVFFVLKIEGASGFQIPSEDSLELCLSQTGLAKGDQNFKPSRQQTTNF